MSPIQLSLLPEPALSCEPIGDWAFDDELGTEEIPVPNRQNPELGTKNNQTFSVPNSDLLLPIGCLEQKVIKSKKYWYWRYYDTKGHKRSRYSSSDYNKAITKARSIGVPDDAKRPKAPRPKTNP
jgi:hypothetical protein